MAVPAFLDTDFRYLETAGVTDVATIITDLRSELVTNGDWTEPTAGTFLSATDDATGGAYKIAILTSRVSQTRCQLKYLDMNNNTIYDGTIDIDASNNVRYYTGPYHCSVDSIRGTPEGGFGAIVCMSPQTIVGHARAGVKCARTSAGSLNNAWGSNMACQGAGALITNNACYHFASRPAGTVDATWFSGAYFIEPMMVTNTYFIGCLYQHVFVPSAIAAQTEIVIEVDTGVTYTFKVLSCSATSNRKVAARKA